MNQDLPAMPVQTGKERLRTWLEPQRAAAMLLSVLGLAALGLAITGLYALLAQMVTQRVPEIAVRMALGASRMSVAGMLLRQSAILIAAGAAFGIAASVTVTRLLADPAGPVNALDGITLIGVAVLLMAFGGAATLVPAFRALHIDPVRALRAD